jgi:outer membrane protein OmpA-like peptidoglycan-associated protein
MKALKLFLMILFSAAIVAATAQVDVKGKVKNQTNNRANNRVDQGINKGLDKIEEGIGGMFKKKKPEDTQQSDQTQQQPENGAQNTATTAPATPSLQSYSKYDFVPGEKVIFYEDFSQDAVGDFPALWNTNGSAEVVTTNLFPGNWLQFKGRGAVWTDQLLDLPDNYTIEYDIIPIKGEEGRMAGYDFRLIQAINEKSYDTGAVPGKAGYFFGCEYFGRPGYRSYISGPDGEGLGLSGFKDDNNLYQKENQKYHISIWVQKSRVRLYQNETKLFDLPKAFPVSWVKMDRIRFEEGAGLVSNIRIAVGAPDTRNKLMTEGKLVTYGIYFDVNKDVVKPESYGTLKEIATILNEVPDVKVKIVGHTDADGADDMNLDLSKRRAASVKAELAKSFGVKADRLETDGMGESQPVAPNDTPVNKALNRRVEFIKL